MDDDSLVTDNDGDETMDDDGLITDNDGDETTDNDGLKEVDGSSTVDDSTSEGALSGRDGASTLVLVLKSA
jgi:hypothetical protein